MDVIISALIEANKLLNKKDYYKALDCFECVLNINPTNNLAIIGKTICIHYLKSFDNISLINIYEEKLNVNLKLARAFGNLLKNAISYSYENTTITINMIENEENIEITFKNKGATIPEYKLERIFDKFYRADESRQTNNGGAGLGLAITKEIIELHNGKICAKSNDEFIEFQIELKK